MNALPLTRRIVATVALVLGLACSSSIVFGQAAPMVEALPAEAHLESVEQWDQVMESLRKVMWGAQAAGTAKDARGRSAIDDLSEYVLTADIVKKLDSLREEARAK